MFRKFSTTSLIATLLLPATLWAQSFTFTNLSEQDFEDITKELSGNFMHHSVQGAAPLGDIFGFELGLIGGQQATPKIDEIIKRSGGSGSENLVHAGILGVVSVPFGITGEVVMIPKVGSNDADFQMTSMALKLSLNTELLKVLPFNLALRGLQSNSKFSFSQTQSGAEITVTNNNTVSGVQILASPSLPLLEPYVGVGFLTGRNSLSTSGASVFDPSFNTSSSGDSTVSSQQFLLGVHANLLLVHLGAEYSTAFGASTITGKLAFGF